MQRTLIDTFLKLCSNTCNFLLVICLHSEVFFQCGNQYLMNFSMFVFTDILFKILLNREKKKIETVNGH